MFHLILPQKGSYVLFFSLDIILIICRQLLCTILNILFPGKSVVLRFINHKIED